MLSQATLRQLYIWPPKDMLNSVHSSFIYNSPKMETSQMSVSRTDKQTGIVHTIINYMAIKDKLMIDAATWMDLKSIVLSENNQA